MGRKGAVACIDCVEGMGLMPVESVDLIATDPPFAIDFNSRQSSYNRKEINVLKGYNEVPQQDYHEFSVAWMREAYRVLKVDGSMYVCSGWTNLRDVLNALHETGWHVTNHIEWKYQFGVVTTRRFVTSHYTIVFACKDDKKRRFYPYSRFGKNERSTDGRSLHYADKEDVWAIPREYWRGKTKTPNKLPGALVEKMLAYSSVPGDRVMDPFSGSGQVGVHAVRAGRKFTGFDIVQDYCDFANGRIEKAGKKRGS